MKWLLGISILLNILLGVRLYLEPSSPVVKETSTTFVKPKTPRTQKMMKPVAVETRGHVVSEIPEKNKGKKIGSRAFEPHDGMYEYQDADDKMRNDKNVFLTENLGLLQSDLDRLEKIKGEYNQELANIGKDRGVFLPSLKEKKRMIELEEKRNAKIEKLLGKQKFNQYNKFIENYNNEIIKRHNEDGGIIIPMDI